MVWAFLHRRVPTILERIMQSVCSECEGYLSLNAKHNRVDALSSVFDCASLLVNRSAMWI